MRFADKEILRLAWPAILTNISAPLMSLIDTAVVGHLGSAEYIAGIALGGAVFNMIYWLLNFMRTGTSGLTGQAVGRGDTAMAVVLLRRMSMMAAVAGVLIIVFGNALCDGVMLFMDAGDGAQAPAREYFSTAVWGAPAMLGSYVLSGWFVGEQDTRPILWMALGSNILNAVLSPLLAFGAGMSIAGIALATAISQWMSLLIGAAMLRAFMHKNSLHLNVRPDGKSQPIPWSKLFHINTDIFLRTVCLVAVTLWFTRAGARISTVVLAANAVLMQMFMLFSFFVDGFAFAGEALAAKCFGGKCREGLMALVRRLMLWGTAVAAACSVIYFLLGQGMIDLLTDSTAVRDAAADMRLWIVAVPLCGFMAFTWDGVFIGMTLTRQMLLSMAIAMAVFFGVYFLAAPAMSVHGLWLAFVLYLAARGAAQHLLFRRYMARHMT